MELDFEMLGRERGSHFCIRYCGISKTCRWVHWQISKYMCLRIHTYFLEILRRPGDCSEASGSHTVPPNGNEEKSVVDDDLSHLIEKFRMMKHPVLSDLSSR